MYATPKKLKDTIVNQRSLQLHKAIADKVLASPHLLEKAKDNLEARYNNGLMRYGSYMLWQGILETAGSPETFKQLLLAQDERTASLRKSTIFVGILTEQEREDALSAMP
ncbi:hypothetical protein GTH32_07005 [Alteromonas sp. 345S023]|uniref:Uncharacterized protein n=1 Tax=Alteromonas profundi TaxID=2696062 RepID=A0A7X5RKF7_9ALTE|nr:hypothetical protein [Alteromonas profundi]NDV90948.1 hypothetical protein [Alteromonas profundi]